MQQGDFISEYIQYASESSEVPAAFYRWAVIAGIGAFLGRQYYFHHGHFTLYPNIYAMLIGSPGTRKSSAIKLMKKILIEAGYSTIAADRTTKEKFLMDLAGETGELDGTGKARLSPEELLEQNLFGDGAESTQDAEVFIMADEFNDFFGHGNIEFISLLGTLWDYSGVYRSRIKNGKSISVNNPTISILGGNTPTGFSLAFPTEILGQGFFSRILLIYGEPNGKRIAFPRPPSPQNTFNILKNLKELRLTSLGEAKLSSTGEKLFEKIYSHRAHVDDVRFESYSNRRFTHLIKLALITSAARRSSKIEEQDIIYANTILTYTEQLMPRALGEFGKAKHSDVSHKIIQLAEGTHDVLTFKEIWRHVNNDLEKMQDLATLLQNLVAADKLQAVPGGKGFLPKKRVIEYSDSSLFNYELLTEEERRLVL
jgi:Protein of unknown function (DUF3987)